jgi:hypothetical protein
MAKALTPPTLFQFHASSKSSFFLSLFLFFYIHPSDPCSWIGLNSIVLNPFRDLSNPDGANQKRCRNSSIWYGQQVSFVRQQKWRIGVYPSPSILLVVVPFSVVVITKLYQVRDTTGRIQKSWFYPRGGAGRRRRDPPINNFQAPRSPCLSCPPHAPLLFRIYTHTYILYSTLFVCVFARIND